MNRNIPLYSSLTAPTPTAAAPEDIVSLINVDIIPLHRTCNCLQVSNTTPKWEFQSPHNLYSLYGVALKVHKLSFILYCRGKKNWTKM